MICFNNRTARRGVPQRAVKMHRRLSLPSVFLVAALIGSVGNAHAIECQSEKGAGYPWAWRLIDGKRCWYKGNAGMDKKLLSWSESGTTAPAAAAKSTATAKRRPPVTAEDAERERLLRSYWPPLPPADVFGDRFNAVRGERL